MYRAWVALALTLLALAPLTVSAAAPVTLPDVNGVRHQPLVAKDNRATVFFFLAHDCPISNGYAPEMNRICARYAPAKVGFYMVYTDSDTRASEERKHAKAFGFRCPALRDPSHILVQQVGVTTTPEVAVVAPSGKLLYRGRIDNTYAQVGIRRNQTTEHDLRDALDAILQNRPVLHPTTPAIGCYISPAK